jgi:hypothetical protein
LEPEQEVMGNQVWVILNLIPHELVSYSIIRRLDVREDWEVLMEVLPLYISRAEGHKDRRGVGRETASESLKAVTLVPPERPRSGQLRALTDDVGQEGLICRQGLGQLLPTHILQDGGFGDIEASRVTSLSTHQNVKNEEPPARVPTKSPILIAHQVSSILC